jgi:hypothetical protein
MMSEEQQTEEQVSLSPVPPKTARIVVIEQVYHQEHGQQPTLIDHSFVRMLDSDEQPYVRKITVGEQWERLDTGWVAKVGMIVFTNDEGKNFHVNPTDAQKADVADRVVEVCFDAIRSSLVKPPHIDRKSVV